MKILNLYSCLGGNRYKWNDVKEDIEVTAVEYDPEIANLYQERFPNDTVIVGDAHQYLLDNYSNFDFIWSSPPCPTHSKARFARRSTTSAAYPDMRLYEEIVFLQNWFEGRFCVENVVPYYEPLIEANKRGRHLYWTNFDIPKDLGARASGTGLMNGKGVTNEVDKWCEFHEYNFRQYKGSQRRDKIARNLVDYEVGKNIFKAALGIEQDKKQIELF